MDDLFSIEKLLQQGHLAQAQNRFGDFLHLCAKEAAFLALNKGELAQLEADRKAGLATDIYALNRITLNFRENIEAFREDVLEKYFDVQDRLSYFDSISDRDAVINQILDHRLLPKNYEREQLMTEGNSSIVYRLVNPVLYRHAIALVLKTPYLDEDSKKHIMRLADLRHRNVIKLLDHDLSSFPFFVITEYIYGINLPKALDINGPRPATQAVDWLYQLTDALDYLRHKRIFHTNVRPSKIYIDDEWQVMISPFDLGHFSSNEQTYNRYRDVCQYGSPEMVKCDGIGLGLDEMCVSDQYSLGLLAYKILTGMDLFPENTIYGILQERHRFATDADYRKKRLDVLPNVQLQGLSKEVLQLRPLIEKLLSEDPSDRFPTLHGVLRALHPFSRAEELNVSPLRQSYRRCLAHNKEFINDFYEAFTLQTRVVEPTEEVPAPEPANFAQDFSLMGRKRQSTMLQMAVDLLIDIDAAGDRLSNILNAQQHQKYGRMDFDSFITVLGQKMKENDPQWSEELQLEWQSVKEKTIKLLKK
jgi:serine/threonine protein kinase